MMPADECREHTCMTTQQVKRTLVKSFPTCLVLILWVMSLGLYCTEAVSDWPCRAGVGQVVEETGR